MLDKMRTNNDQQLKECLQFAGHCMQCFEADAPDDADPGPAGSAVVAAIYRYTRTTEILWRKRDVRPLLQEESTSEHPDPCLDRLLLFF